VYLRWRLGLAFVVLFLVLASQASGGGERQAPGAPRFQSAVDRVAREVLELPRHAALHAPGVALSVSIDGRRQTFVAGTSNLTGRAPLRSGQLMAVGSVTKLYTAVLVMQLIERGRLSLSATVAEVAKRNRPNSRPLRLLLGRYPRQLRGATVRDLLRMTSGIGDFEYTPQLRGALRRRPLQRRSLAELSSWGLAISPARASKRPRYSNTNYALLGLIAEAVEGSSISEQMSELFDQAGLDQTRYLTGVRDARRLLRAGSLAHGYIPVPTPLEDPADDKLYRDFTLSPPRGSLRARLVKTELAPPVHRVSPRGKVRVVRKPVKLSYREASGSYSFSLAGSAGAAASTTSDLNGFLTALREGAIIRASTLKTMERAVGSGQNRFGLGLMPIQVPQSGLYTGSPKLTLWGHAGEIWGYNAAAFYVQGRDIVISYAFNVSPGDELNNAFLTDVLATALRNEPTRSTTPTTQSYAFP
jgi:CubicO group peptidase (beta-lactamase class C family)